jgi:hypothetical protein
MRRAVVLALSIARICLDELEDELEDEEEG